MPPLYSPHRYIELPECKQDDSDPAAERGVGAAGVVLPAADLAARVEWAAGGVLPEAHHLEDPAPHPEERVIIEIGPAGQALRFELREGDTCLERTASRACQCALGTIAGIGGTCGIIFPCGVMAGLGYYLWSVTHG